MKSEPRQSQLNLNLHKLKFMTNTLLLLLTGKILLWITEKKHVNEK